MRNRREALRRALLGLAVTALFAPALPVLADDTSSRRDPHSVSGRVTPAKTARPSPASAVSPPAIPAADSASKDRDEVLKAFSGWIAAWNAKDVNAYFAAYAAAFRPPNGESRGAWERQRRIRIWNKSYINVSAESPEITVKQDRATVRFVQIYLSDRLRDESTKSMTFVKHNGKWQIIQEQVH
jgi:hypothetical protein